MQLEYTRMMLGEIKLNPKNARQHNEKDLLVLAASLEKYGQVENLVLQKSTNMLIGGNGRFEAMLSLGWIEADVMLVECDDIEASKLGIVLNRSAELSSWNTEAVEQALREINHEDDEVIASMFDELATYLKIVPGPEKEATPPKVNVCPSCGHRWSKDSPESDE